MTAAAEPVLCRRCGEDIARANRFDDEGQVDRYLHKVNGVWLQPKLWDSFSLMFLRVGTPVSHEDFEDYIFERPVTAHHVRNLICMMRVRLRGSAFAVKTHRRTGAASYELVRRLLMAGAILAALAAPAWAGNSFDLATARCSEVTKGHPRPAVAFGEGYILGLLFDGKPNDNNVDQLIALCRAAPQLRLEEMIMRLKQAYKPNEDTVE